MSRSNPAYRHFRPRNLAFVELGGRRIYLGKYGSPESKEKYHRILAERAAANASPGEQPSAEVYVSQLILAYWKHVKQRYSKNGKPTSEVSLYRAALRPVRQLYGEAKIAEFGPLALAVCRDHLKQKHCRTKVNQHVGRIRRMFRWGVAHEIVPAPIWQALLAVEGLRRGEGYDPPKVKPVSEASVQAIKRHVTPAVWAMIQLQLWTGCRPGEVCIVRGCDLNTSGAVWEYRPESHKTEHHGKERIIYLGPEAQAVIKPWLKTDLQAYLFSPAESRAAFNAAKRSKRASPMTPSHARRKPKPHPKRKAGERYTTNTYGTAIERGCERAGVGVWSPNQLRHAAATRIRKHCDVDLARIILGHQSVSTTEIYAEKDRAKAIEAMQRLG